MLPLVGLVLLGAATAGLAWFLVGDDDLELLVTEPTGIALLVSGARTDGRVCGPARALSGRRAGGAARRRAVPRARAARRGGGVPPASALRRDRRGRDRARLPDRPRRASAGAAPRARAAARGARHPRRDVVSLDMGRARRCDRARVLRVPVPRRPGHGRPSTRGGLAPACAPRSRLSPSARSSRRSGSGRRTRERCSSAATSRSRTPTPRSSASPRSSRTRACTGDTWWCRSPCCSSRSSSGRGRTIDWIAAAAAVAFLFWGLFYSYSQSSFVALFVVAFAVAIVGADRRARLVLLTCAAVATLAAAAVAGASVGDRSAQRRDEWSLPARDRDLRGVQGETDRGCRDRRTAARELRDRAQGLAEQERVPHDAADDPRGVRRDRVRPLRLAAGRRRVGVAQGRPPRPRIRRRPRRRPARRSSCTHSCTRGSSRIR